MKRRIFNDNENCVLTCRAYSNYNYNEMKCSECLHGCINYDNMDTCKNFENGLYLFNINVCL